MSAENCNIDLGCKVRNPLFHKGTSQRERFIAALAPEYFKADERSLEQLLIVAAEYAKLINYYDFNNYSPYPLDPENPVEPEKPELFTWEKFIASDAAFVLARIAVTDVSKWRISFEEKVRELERNYGSNHANDDVQEFSDLLSEVASLAKLISTWYTSANNAHSVRAIIKSFIDERLKQQLRRLIEFDKGAEVQEMPFDDAGVYSATFDKYNFLGEQDSENSLWQLTYDLIGSDSSIYIGKTEKIRVINAVSEIRLIFNIFFQAASQIKASAANLLAQSLESSDHKPHVALFITFLRLFRYAQDDLNKFTQKHLDYYYKEVLRLAEKEAEPDNVFLIFELAQNVEQHLIAKETSFDAGQDSLGNDVFFKSTRDVVINKGTISAVNTVFVTKEDGGNNRIKDINAATGANTKNGLGKQPLAEGQFWSLFGESQEGKADSERTMQSANLGFAVSSPVFFLKNGDRTISIALTPITTTSYLPDEVPAIEADLRNSLQVYLSSSEKWLEKKPNRVILNGAVSESTGKYIVSSFVIEILLSKDDPEITSYDKEVLGDTFNTSMPLVKLTFKSGEASVKVYGLKDYDNTHYYHEYNVNPTRTIQPYNSYVLSNGVIYKLIASSSYALDPNQNPGVWKRLETLDDFTADLDSVNINFNNKYPYEPGTIVKVSNDFYIAEASSGVSSLSPHPLSVEGASVWKKITYETSYGYKYLTDIKIREVKLTTDVKGITDLLLHNEEADLDPNKPFSPFGNNPDVGSAFYFGSLEIFQKQLSSLTLNINWDKLPDENFKNYYVGYEKGVDTVVGSTPPVHGSNPTTISINNESFKVDLEILDKGRWTSLAKDLNLFDTQFLINQKGKLVADVNLYPPSQSRIITVNNQALNKILRDPALPAFDNFQNNLAKGFARIVLKKTTGYNKEGKPIAAPIRVFGNKEYNLLFTTRIINKSTNKLPDLLPNNPYVPVMKELTLDYVSSVTFNLESTNANEFQNRVDQFFHIEVFGQKEVQRQLLKSGEEIFAVPQYKDEGSLYLGISNILPLQNITILFQLKEGTEDTSIPGPLSVQWSYLSNNSWITIPKERISFDGTEKFIKSGIVEIALPEDITDDNTCMPSGLRWLRVSMPEKTKAINKALRVVSQAIQAQFANNNNDPTRVGVGLPAKTITDLTLRDVEIDTVSQPFASYGGKLQEQSNTFYNRVSERLRHKSRAITIWDYQRLVLEKFNQVYRAKCLNHTSGISGLSTSDPEAILATEAKPGFVTVIVIPQLKDFVTQEAFEPKVGVTLVSDIKKYLQQYVSPFVQLEVENALFEKVQAKFEVVFKKGLDRAFYTALLNEDIKRFLAPWAFDSTQDITFGGRLQKSVLVNFIEKRPYVDYVLHFHLLQQACIGSDTYKEVEEVIARTSRTVLSSAQSHLITALLEEEVVCDDGIGAMIAERTFIVR